MSISFGEVSWDKVGGGRRTNFIKLQQGSNEFMIAGNPVQYSVMFLTLPDGSNRKINTPVGDAALVRRLEESGFKAKNRYLIKVLDVKSNTFGIIDGGFQIVSGLRRIHESDRFVLSETIVDIVRGPKGSNPLYTVMPVEKQRMDPALREKFVEFNDGLDIDRLISPADSEYVMELMGWDSPSTGGGSEDAGGFAFSYS